MNSHPKLARAERDVFTVSRLNRTVKELVELTLGMVWVEGEISNLSKPASGHLYFSLKDARAQVRCAFFKQRARNSRVTLEHGQQIRVRARASLYEPRGDYQLIVESVELAGDGALQQRYLDNLKRFEAEGLFDTDRKRPLPSHPTHIGVVTSATGAAVRDVVEVLRRRYPIAPVMVYPTAVQGANAATEVAAAIDLANDHGVVDVLLVVRGGGSLEDLWAFNEEAVVRAIARSRIPTVSGVGHEVDTTLADFAADSRAPTPSAAAELISPPLEHLQQRLVTAETRLRRNLVERTVRYRTRCDQLIARLHRQHPERKLETASQRLDRLDSRLGRVGTDLTNTQRSRLALLQARLANVSPTQQIAARRAYINALSLRLRHTLQTRVSASRSAFHSALRALDTVSPLATLERGYAVVRHANSGAVVHDADSVEPSDRLRIRVRHGEIIADAVSTTHPDTDQ